MFLLDFAPGHSTRSSETMNHSLWLSVVFLFCSQAPTDAGDLFAPTATKVEPTEGFKKYKTFAALLEATRSGEVPGLLNHFSGDYNPIINALQTLFKSDGKYPNIAQYQASATAQLLVEITEYEQADEQRKPDIEARYKRSREFALGLPEDKPFAPVMDSFLKDYSRALREYVANKQQEAQKIAAAEMDRQVKADLAEKKLKEERRQAMELEAAKTIAARAEEEARRKQAAAVMDSKIASVKAEEEARASAVRGAMAEQAMARAQKLQETLDSPAYKIWLVSLQIEEGLRMIKEGRAVLAKDESIGKESGVTDLAMRRAAGEKIVAGKALVDKAFAFYQALGGKAVKPEDVEAGADPARNYR